MTGLRDRMKQRRREAILRAAERLFREQGYTGTNIEDIAAKAEVSIGTLYKYFGSKGGIMHELIQPVIDDMRIKGQQVIDDSPPNALEAIINLFEAYRFNDDWKSLNLLKAFDPHAGDRDKHLSSVGEEFENFIRGQLMALISKLVKLKAFNPSLDVEDVGYILYKLLMAHFESYVEANGQRTYEDVLKHLHRRLRVVLERWALD